MPFNKIQIKQQANFAYSPLGKMFRKQTEKEVHAIKSLEPSNKFWVVGTFSVNLMNNLTRGKLKEIVELQNIIIFIFI